MPWESEAVLPKKAVPETVTEITTRLKSVVEARFDNVYVEGEISDWRGASASGHIYFALKDKGALISCVIWRGSASKCDVTNLKNGVQIEIRGRIALYEARGHYQIVVTSAQRAGIGLLWQKFEELKAKLTAEGMFDEKRKRPINTFPKKIGVVTATTGAVIRDILTVLKRRAPHIDVVVANVKVQGDGSAKEIVTAIETLNKLKDLDLLIVGRGGGSMQDLWSFNEEIVARAIIASQIPVISAVGHETDFTIADFVADLRAPTPSAAAEIVSKHSAETIRALENMNHRMRNVMLGKMHLMQNVRDLTTRLLRSVAPSLERYKLRLNALTHSHAIMRPFERIQKMRQQLDGYQETAYRLLNNRMVRYTHRHEMLDAKVMMLSPLAVLNRGYSIVYREADGNIVRSVEHVQTGDALKVQLAQGSFPAIVAGSHIEDGSKRPTHKKTSAKKAKTPQLAQDDLFGNPDEWGFN